MKRNIILFSIACLFTFYLKAQGDFVFDIQEEHVIGIEEAIADTTEVIAPLICETGTGEFSYGNKTRTLKYASVYQTYYNGYTFSVHDSNHKCENSNYQISIFMERATPGTYTYCPYHEKKYAAEKHFHSATYINFSDADYLECEKGTFTITPTGNNTYELTYNFTLDNGKKLKGRFLGSFDHLTENDVIDIYDYFENSDNTPDLTLFSDMEIDSIHTANYKGSVKIDNHLYPINYVAEIKKGADIMLCFMPEKPVEFSSTQLLKSSGTFLLMLKVPVDNAGSMTETPLFYENGYYFDKKIHFSSAYCYFFPKDGETTYYETCSEGFFRATKEQEGYIIDFTLIFENSTLIDGSYRGAIDNVANVDFNDLPLYYDYSYDSHYDEYGTPANPFPDFSPESVTLSNAYISGNTTTSMPYAYVVNDEMGIRSRLILTDHSLTAEGEYPEHVLIFEFMEPVETLSDTTLFYDSNIYTYLTVNTLNAITFSKKEGDISYASSITKGALYITQKNEHYHIVYKTSDNTIEITGSLEGEVEYLTNGELYMLNQTRLKEKGFGNGTVVFNGNSYEFNLLYIFKSPYQDNEIACLLVDSDFLLTDDVRHLFAFYFLSEDGKIPEGTFQYKSLVDKKYDPKKNFSGGAFGVYGIGGGRSDIYGEIDKGFITIKRENDHYFFSFDVAFKKKDKMTGNYQGKAQQIIEKD